jgi:dTDP-glucose 4,6-dehydratase/UDP-glucose 4-epimerase
MKFLILGSEGFIGSHLVRYFHALDFEVFEADITLKDAQNYFLINPELPDFSFLFLKNQFDVCINATGAANVQLSFKHPSLDFALNASNVYNILDAIRLYNPQCRFINLSSAAVYGNPRSLPVSETDDLRPLSPYGFHKLYSEQICNEFHSLFGINTLSIRIFSAYGEGLKKQLFWDLYQKLLIAQNGDKVINLFGTGRETRDFIYVHDICRCVELILKNAEFDGRAINIASGIEIKIEDAVRHFISLYDADIVAKFSGNEKTGDPVNWRADITKIKNLGFSNPITIEDGLQNFVKWLKEKVSQ